MRGLGNGLGQTLRRPGGGVPHVPPVGTEVVRAARREWCGRWDSNPHVTKTQDFKICQYTTNFFFYKIN